MLTGDKVDTAKNIGYSCKLLVRNTMKLLEYPKEGGDPFQNTKDLRESQIQAIKGGQSTAYIVTGELLTKVMGGENEDLSQLFTEIALQSDVVLCCRVSPKQKQEIVAMVKKAVSSELD